MTFLGKVLIVVQVVLSLCFMAFAGAVVAVHQNWKDLYEQEKTSLAQARDSFEQTEGAWQTERDGLEDQVADIQADLDEALNNATLFESELAQSQDREEALEQTNQRLEGELEAAGLEAEYRREEAEQQRRENLAQQAALDASQTEIRAANDQIFELTVQLAELQRQHTETLEENAQQRTLLVQNGIDPNEVPRLVDVLAPPPAIDGRILEVNLDEAGRPHMVLLSIGQDDGLQVGHVLDVYRVVNEETLYIGQVRITSTLPDKAVADVLRENRNGIIEVADHVTTRL